jgi:hypothetical protein
MRARRAVDFRERAINPGFDQWTLIAPDADAYSDDEDKLERERRVKIYAKDVAKNRPIEFIKEVE